MAKRNKKNNKSGIVYSTDNDFLFDEEEEIIDSLPPEKQNLKVSLDKKQRKGKQVTLVTGFLGNENDLKELGKLLKNKCGVGGSVKDNEIIIQGDFTDKILNILLEMKYKIKKLG